MQNISLGNSDVGNRVTLAWCDRSGEKGQNNAGAQELGAGGTGKWGVTKLPGGLLPLGVSLRLVPLAGTAFVPVACTNVGSGTSTVAEWRCERISKCGFVISVLDVYIVIK